MQCSSNLTRIAGLAREYLIKAKGLEAALLPNAYRALLMSSENAYYLKQLQIADFNVFDKGLMRPSYFKVPLRVFKAARNKTFVNRVD